MKTIEELIETLESGLERADDSSWCACSILADGDGLQLLNDLKDAVAARNALRNHEIELLAERRDQLKQRIPRCQKCGEEKQIQLVNWFQDSPIWKCRICKNTVHVEIMESK